MANEDNISPDKDPGFDEEIPFEDFESGGNTLGDLLRNNPLVKVGVVLGGFAAIIGGVILFGGKGEPVQPSIIQPASDLKEPPATDPVSPVMQKALEEKNQADLEDALRKNESVIPVPIAPPKGGLEVREEKAETEDPLERWRRIQEERIKREQKAAQQQVLPETDPSIKAIQDMSQAMSTQMESILGGIQPVRPKVAKVTKENYLEEKARQAAAAQAQAAEGEAAGEEEEIIDIIIPAGTIEYAQLLLEANSDVKGPIMAQLVSGPLAGSRMLGSFDVREEYIVLNFKTIVVDGVSQSIDAVALNPDDANIGMVTDIDHRYFSRIILPAAAAFIEGMGSAIASTGSSSTVGAGGATTSTTQEPDAEQELFKGIEKAAEKVSDIVDKEGEGTKPLIKVAAGTPMGVLFMAPVTEDSQ